jgi:hypothetical protein
MVRTLRARAGSFSIKAARSLAEQVSSDASSTSFVATVERCGSQYPDRILSRRSTWGSLGIEVPAARGYRLG